MIISESTYKEVQDHPLSVLDRALPMRVLVRRQGKPDVLNTPYYLQPGLRADQL